MKKIVIIFLIIHPLTVLFSFDFPSLPGWQQVGEVKMYHSDNLWEYINGAADHFISYGFEELTYGDISKDELTVTVNIYDMGNNLNAFGIYTSEKGREQETLDIGIESLLSLPYQCLLLKGQYYIKIDVFEGELTREKGIELLKALSDAMPGSNEVPKELALLPAENKVEGTENFIKEDFLGLETLSNCVFAEYKEDTLQYRVFKVIIAEEQVKEYYSKLEEKWNQKEFKGCSILFREVPYAGYVGVCLIDGINTGVAGLEDKQKLFENLYTLSNSAK